MTLTPYYDQRGITIYCGDCLEVMPQLEPGVDAIITDLPYGTTACSWDTVIPFAPMWKRVKRLLKPTGAFVTTASQPFTSALVMSNPKWFRCEWIWEKERPTNIFFLKNQIAKYHENILVFYKNQSTYNPQMEKRKGTHSQRKKDYDLLRCNNNGSKTHLRQTYKYSKEYNPELIYPKSILRINRDRQKNAHPTQKPVALMEYMIKTYTNPHELILDITMGSGTTLVAAQNEGRRAIGIELSEEYCAIAVDRLRQPSFFSLPVEPKANGQAKQIALLGEP